MMRCIAAIALILLLPLAICAQTTCVNCGGSSNVGTVTCTNQFVTAVAGTSTCGTVTSAFVDSSILPSSAFSSNWGKVPAENTFTLINSPTASSTGNFIELTLPSTAGTQWRTAVLAMPATPAKLIVQMRAGMWNLNTMTAGIYFVIGSDGTGAEEGMELLTNSTTLTSNIQARIERLTNTSTDNATDVALTTLSLINPWTGIWLQVRDDGTSMFFDWSNTGDAGTFHNLGSVTHATLGGAPTFWGIGGVNAGSTGQPLLIDIGSWKVAANATL